MKKNCAASAQRSNVTTAQTDEDPEKSMKRQQRIKLLGRESRDIVTLSGLVQDAIFVPADMTLDVERKRFVAVINRFQWERAARLDDQDATAGSILSVDETSAPEADDARFEDDIHSGYTRSFAALTVEGISGARTKAIKMGVRDQFLSVMALVPDDRGLTLVCAGEAAIRLSGTGLRVFLEDLGEAWPTQRKPAHDDDPALVAAQAPALADIERATS